MTRVLLTGGGGFVGSHTFAHLMHHTDWEVVVLDSFRHRGKTDRLAQMLGTNPEWRRRLQVEVHDLRAPLSDQLAHRIGPVDHIVNMASESHVDRSIEAPVEFVRNNVDVALNMLEFARVALPKVFVQVSTDEVYGPMPDAPHPEWSPIVPSNPYAASKACQEAAAVSWWRTYGVPLVITNTMNVIGEMQDPEKYLPMLVQRISRGDEVTIHGTEADIGSRFYLHARNAADAILFVLQDVTPARFPDQDRPTRLNVVGEQRVDNLELAGLVADLIGRPLRYRLVDFHSTRPGHDPHYGLDGSLLASLGWKPPVTFHESLRHTVEWSLAHPEWSL